MTGYTSDAQLLHQERARARELTFAGVLLVVSGIVNVVQGVIALADGSFFTASGQSLYSTDPTVWGWVQLIGGVVVVVTGIAVTRRVAWSRPIAVTIAAISMLTSFLWFPFHVFGSMLVIAIDGLIIGAVTAPGVFEKRG